MTEKEIVELINSSLAEEFELERSEMTPDAHLIDDFELDSLDFVDLVVVLQNAFGFKLRDDKAMRDVRTLGDIHRLVMVKLQEQGSQG